VLGLLSFLRLLFPSGQLVSARWRPVAWAAAAGTVLLGLWAAFAPEPLDGAGLERLTNPLGIHGAEAIFKVLQAAAAVLLGRHAPSSSRTKSLGPDENGGLPAIFHGPLTPNGDR
jgi:hypothetical protein